jgi:dTDP-4-amino-4,6-dideoxygalactose transaminase
MSSLDGQDEIPNVRPYFEMDEEGLRSLTEALASGRATNNGVHVQRFERLLAEYLGVNEAVAVSNGSDALLLALIALDRPRGKAILPAYTYVATLNAVVHAGLDPVFCDIHTGSFTMDGAHLGELLERTSDVRCVLPVNVFGVPPDLREIRALCDRVGATLVYDNAHGFGTEVNGRRLAGEPEIQVFSFHATKTLPAVEGGLIVTEDPAILSSVRRLRNHGLGQVASDFVPGFNAKMDEIRAIIGTCSLRGFPDALARRRSYGQRLCRTFGRFEGVYEIQAVPKDVSPSFQNLGVRCPRAASAGLEYVLGLFRARGIGVRSYFDPPLHTLKGYAGRSTLPATESVWRTLVSLPIHSRMTEAALCRIEDAARDVAKHLQSLPRG